MVQEEGKVCKVFVTDSFAYVVVQLHLRRFRVKLKDVPDFAHGQAVLIGERHFGRITGQFPCVARKLCRYQFVTVILHVCTSSIVDFDYRFLFVFASANKATCSISAA